MTCRKNLLETHPNIAAEWDYERNNPLTPLEVSKGQTISVWWRCANGHSYEARIDHRCSMHSGCRYCAPNGAPLKGENDLLTVYPEIAAEWDYVRNEKKPDEYRPYSNKSVYWICPICGNSYPQKIHNRTLNGFGCPQCMKESHTSMQEQTLYFYLSQVTDVENRAKVHGMELDIFLPSFNVGIEYNGEYYHKSKQQHDKKKAQAFEESGIRTIIINCGRTRELCGDQITLETTEMSNPRDDEFTWGLKQIFILLDLPAPDIDLQRDRIAIYGLYIKSIKDKSLATAYPLIAKEWDYEKNKGLSPSAFSFGSHKSVWWKCPECDLSYDMIIYNRTTGKQNCPYCSGKRICEGYNDLATTHSELIKEWDASANEKLPHQYTHGSKYKAAWICQKCGHRWHAAIYSRVQGKGCPTCAEKQRGIRRKKSIQAKSNPCAPSNNAFSKDT